MLCRGKCNFSPQDVFPLMKEAMCCRGKCKFLLQDVLTLMREAMRCGGKCKFSPMMCSLSCGKPCCAVGNVNFHL